MRSGGGGNAFKPKIPSLVGEYNLPLLADPMLKLKVFAKRIEVMRRCVVLL